MLEVLAKIGIVPVVVVEQVAHALPLADALLAGGMQVVEVTFRTEAAADVIRAIRAARPQLLVGAGTLVTAENVKAATAAGAQFGVAPGCNSHMVSLATSHELPFIPGVCTPSDIEMALSLGCRVLKFFPSAAVGGIEYLDAIAAPYRHFGLRYMPTGGVTVDNLETYLSSPDVACVGGTWLARAADLNAGHFGKITERCQINRFSPALLRGSRSVMRASAAILP
jgi:2-dehydro-3-deoxyphosphogluconate aldolase/(4S)-4-hydroxy-2-oxoglutarate aldolase